MSHVVLLGDSIFDNAAYVPGDAAVSTQVQAALPSDWQATLLAVDGDTTDMVAVRLRQLPKDATHLVVSVGGNDALMHAHLVEARANVLPELATVRAAFADRYRAMMDAVLAHDKPTLLCTIYDSVPGLLDAAKMALAGFNDVITREASRRGLPVLDLRVLCTEECDYSPYSPIEPSVHGGAKIAALIAGIVTQHDFKKRWCVVYG